MTGTSAILFQVIVRQCPNRVLGIRPVSHAEHVLSNLTTVNDGIRSVLWQVK
jgi:hypothetical protein